MDTRPRCISKSALRAALVALNPGLDKILPPATEPTPAITESQTSAPPKSPEVGGNSLSAIPAEGRGGPTSKIPDPPDWTSIANQVRLQQYEVSQQLLAAARLRLSCLLAGD